MRLLTPDELNSAIFEIDEETGETLVKPDAYVEAIKAQQELTNKEWREWFEQVRARDDSDGQLWHCISDPHWQARLKEIENATQV